MKTITITTYPSMPDRFRVDCKSDGEPQGFGRDAKNSGEAAAVAINYARDSGENYVILGHKAAVDQIPQELRSRFTGAA